MFKFILKNTSLKLGLILLASLVSHAGFSQEKHQVRMAFMGNSITQGSGLSDPANDSYPAQLNKMFTDTYGDTVSIYNAGVSARTMMRSSEIPLWNESKFASALTFVPDICLILLGTNDSQPVRWEAWGDEFETDYQAMVDTFKVRNPNTKFIICLPPPIWPGQRYGTDWNDLHNDTVLVEKAIPAMKRVAAQNDAMLVDFHTFFVNEVTDWEIDAVPYFPDNLHPDPDGAGLMAQLLFDSIKANDLMHEVEAGNAYVSSFKQAESAVALGSVVKLSWTTIFADEVLLDGEAVDINGSKEVLAEAGKTYTLTAKGANNTSTFELKLNTYTPEATELRVSFASNDYLDGLPVELYADFFDQNGQQMTEKPTDVTWTIEAGEAVFGEETDTSIVIIPKAEGDIVVKAQAGDFSGEKTLRVRSYTPLSTMQGTELAVYPNPVAENLSVRFTGFDTQGEIKVVNLWGQVVLSKSLKATDQQVDINVSSLPQGMYFYSLQFEGESKVQGKFIKSR